MVVGETSKRTHDSFESETPTSRIAFQRAAAVMPGGAKGAYYYAPYPLFFERGDGCRVTDVDGREFLDCANHHTAQILGHNHPAVSEAINRQVGRGVVLGGPTGAETELAEEMCGRVESLERIRFCNSGTEATLHAIRMARGVTGRSRIAKFEGGYHGSHDAVEISVAPPVESAGDRGAPVPVAGVRGLAPGATGDVLVLPYDDVEAAVGLIEAHASELACVLLDPKAGILEPVEGLAEAVSATAGANDVLVIVDEVVAFRLARGGWQQLNEITPDLTTYGKLIGGGFPIGAFGGRAELMDRLDMREGATGFHQSGTFSAHPVAMAAGLATLKEMTPEAFQALDQLGSCLAEGLSQVAARHELPLSWVVSGSLFSLYFADHPPRGYRDLAGCRREWNSLLFHQLIERGYYLSHSLAMNAFSLAMKPGDVQGLVTAIDESLESLVPPTT